MKQATTDERTDALVRLLSQKGYRKDWRLYRLDSAVLLVRASAANCLAKAASWQKDGTWPDGRFEMEAFAPYSDKVTCRLTLQYSGNDWQVTEALIRQQGTAGEKRFRLRSNQEVPGAMSLEGLFPKPKPWDSYLKRGFKP